jgi:hypothetical protein
MSQENAFLAFPFVARFLAKMFSALEWLTTGLAARIFSIIQFI